MYKSSIINRFRIHQEIAALKRAGKTDLEIAEILRLTPATIQYLVSINLPAEQLADSARGLKEDQRLKLAYQMRQMGKSMAEISQKLQVNIPRVRRMIHRHNWILRHPK
jgi:predicted transcriptional regulator